MKIYSIFLSLLLLNTLVFSQVEVSSRLMKSLEQSKSNNYIRSLILLRDQVNIMELDAKLYNENASLEKRAYEVISALRVKALSTQGNILEYLNTKSEDRSVFIYEPYWITNMIMVEARPEVLREIMTRMDVIEMDIDPILYRDEPIKVEENIEKTESVESGVKLINADKLWELGITGAGRLVMGIDTGVGVNHPALNHKWRGNSSPSWQAWFDPSSGTTTPNDCDLPTTHGTHTMGTMVGRSNTGDSIGVAIDAEWIASNSLCGGGTHTSRTIAAFQWAMDPDSNILTITDMPDAICNSWYDPDISNECSGIYKTTLDAVEAAGIAVVFSAGNEGPGSSTITKPKNISTDEFNTFSVGAISGPAYLGGNTNPIAPFSSRGPSTCGGTGSLLIKPEVSAPGVNVRSSTGANSYTSLSGTSMAAPHVAGAIALLKQFAPILTGKQIKSALYNTAIDLGPAGEDNDYGMGLIDVYEAFLSLGTPDTIPPSMISNLSVIDPTSSSLTLTWSVPEDSSLNGVTGYDIRYSENPISDPSSFYNAAQIPFPALPDSAGSEEMLLVENLNYSTTYYFAVRSKDVWLNWSPVSNIAIGITFGPPEISVDPDSFSTFISQNQFVKDTLRIGNISSGNSTLDFQLNLENNIFPEGSVSIKVSPGKIHTENIKQKGAVENNFGLSFNGSGGPDNFGYKWFDNDEPNGPVYEWNDIVSTGTLVTNWIATGSFDPKDEGYSGPIPLGFDFNFYGEIKNNLYISSNGLVTFNQLLSNIFNNSMIPGANTPNDFIAAFWDDLDGRTQGTVHYKQDGNKFIVQYTNWQRYDAVSSLTFQIVLFSNGRIYIFYKDMQGTTTSATVGIESPSGSDGLNVAYNSTYIKNNLAVTFYAAPKWFSVNSFSGRIYNGNSADIEITYFSEDFPVGNYTMDIIISSNDPIHPSVIIPVKMINQTVPVELISFSVEQVKDKICIEWVTATETNNSGFSIERKEETNDKWSEIGFAEGHGNSTKNKLYSFVDKNIQSGKYVYRLKQVDYDGTFKLSNEMGIEATNPKEFSLSQNYPNPFNPSTIIEFSLPEKSDVAITIYSSLGEVVTTILNKTIEGGYHKVNFDGSSITSGTYIYQIKAKGISGSFIQSKKMIFLK